MSDADIPIPDIILPPPEHEIAKMNARNARAAMLILGAIAIIIVAGGIALAWTGRAIPDALIALGGGAVGAIAGILVPSRD